MVGKSQRDLLEILSAQTGRTHSHSSHGISPLGPSPQAKLDPPSTGHHSNSIDEAEDDEDDVIGGGDDSAPMSENGEAPAERQWVEILNQSSGVATDDINALSLSLATDRQSRSYLGVTSMSAVFRAIFRLCPMSKEHTAQCARAWAGIQAEVPAPPALDKDPRLGIIKEKRCIDFYFDHVHAIVPLLDEQDFRSRYHSADRRDPSWMGLMNMVFCLGSIASGSDGLHEQYYQEARKYIDLDTLGTGNLDALQALCLLGGLYLHYRNSPNMAYSVLGAAHRVAIALGLHREPRRQPLIVDPVEADQYRRRQETRRRTWWSLFCLDTWAGMTQGRPSCGRWDSNTMDTLFPQFLYPEDQFAMSLHASAQFCLINDNIQHRVAQFGRLSIQEIYDFDAKIEEWWASLPALITDASNSSQRFQTAREFIRTRYHGIRLILIRSAILYVANDCRKRTEHSDMDVTDLQTMLRNACHIASEAIEAIALYWAPNRFHIWNSGWYLFQACTIPLLCTAVAKNIPQSANSDTIAQWQASISKALETFSEMRPWMRSSDRSPDIVTAFAEALTAEGDWLTNTPSVTGSLDLFDWCDEQLTELDWNSFLGPDESQALVNAVFPLP